MINITIWLTNIDCSLNCTCSLTLPNEIATINLGKTLFARQCVCVEKLLTVPLRSHKIHTHTNIHNTVSKYKSHLFLYPIRDLCLPSLFALFAITKCYERGKRSSQRRETHRKCFHSTDLVTMNASKGLNFKSHGCHSNKENAFLFVSMLECFVIPVSLRSPSISL